MYLVFICRALLVLLARQEKFLEFRHKAWPCSLRWEMKMMVLGEGGGERGGGDQLMELTLMMIWLVSVPNFWPNSRQEVKFR